jgi:type II restriction enzyme
MTFRDADQDFGCVGIYSEYSELESVLDKIKEQVNLADDNFSNIVSAQGIYKLDPSVFEDFPVIGTITGNGTGLKITSKVFEGMPELFSPSKNNDDDIAILGISKSKRQIRWIKACYLQNNEWLGYFNVIVPQANGSGKLGEPLSNPDIISPKILIGINLLLTLISSCTRSITCRKMK